MIRSLNNALIVEGAHMDNTLIAGVIVLLLLDVS